MQPDQVAEGKMNSVQNDKLQSISRATVKSSIKEIQTNRPYSAVSVLSSAWKPVQNEGLLSNKQLKQKQQNTKQASVIRLKAEVVPAIPAAKKSPKLANKGTLQNPLTTLYFSRTELLSQDQQSKATRRYAVSEEELYLLQKIVMAEAEGEPYQGKVAVANVVLNRLRSANFPDTIRKVIYQKHQFSPVANGRLKRVKPSEDSINAVNDALSGKKAVPDNTYFFLSLKLAQDLTVKNSQVYVKTIGNHTFYK